MFKEVIKEKSVNKDKLGVLENLKRASHEDAET